VDDLGTSRGKRLRAIPVGMPRDSADGKLAVRIVQDRSGEPAALGAGGTDDDHFLVWHVVLLGLSAEF
jgi:hypothetical protein